MKRHLHLLAFALGASLTLSAHAGTLTYQALPATNTDAGSGIDPSNHYTSAVDGGPPQGTSRTINGVPFAPLAGSGNSVTLNNVTVSVASGTLGNLGGPSETLRADGNLGAALSDALTNDAADNNSEQYVVLDPASLTAGKTYDLRVYIANPTNQNRQVSLSFVGDGAAPANTDFFNEDDATSSPGAFTDPNQAYYINFRYTWDGSTTPGFTITQKSGDVPFVLYALTNQESAGGRDNGPPPPQQTVDAGAPPPQADSEPVGDDQIGVASDTFYTDPTLNQSGRWVTVGNYGRCWQPVGVAPTWRPYTVGRWRYANCGWTWDSSEPWGSCTYHYGRWTTVEGVGWCWVPGRVWAPAWCSWRFGHGYVGWAPLPPQAVCNVNVGVSTWADSTYNIGPGYYNFCQAGNLSAESIAGEIIDQEQNMAMIDQTTNITNIVNNNAYIYAGGPNIRVINGFVTRAGHHPFEEIRVDRHFSHEGFGPEGRRTLFKAGVLAFAAPVIIHSLHPHLPKAAMVVKDPKFDHGWKVVKDPKVEEQLKRRIALQSKGLRPETAHAILPGTHITRIVKPGTKIEVNAIRKPGVPFKPLAGKEEIRRPGETIKRAEVDKREIHKPEVTKRVEEEKREVRKPDMNKRVEEEKREVRKPDAPKHADEEKREVRKPDAPKHVEEEKREVRKPDAPKHVEEEKREVRKPDAPKHVDEEKREVRKPDAPKHVEEEKREVRKPEPPKHQDEPKRDDHKPGVSKRSDDSKRESRIADAPKHENHKTDVAEHADETKREIQTSASTKHADEPKHEIHTDAPKHNEDKKKDQQHN